MRRCTMLNYNEIDIIPRYIYLRDVIKENLSINEVQSLKLSLTSSPLVKQVTNLQWEDGSWGNFHGLAATTGKTTTEMALRRLYYLGLDKADTSITLAINYMESFLKDEICLRDYPEKKHDWNLLTKLFVSTWILKYDYQNEIALSIATKWANIINESFLKGKLDSNMYRKAYLHYLEPEAGKSIWQIENFYVVSIVRGLLDFKVEEDFLKHIINWTSGIYYTYDKPLYEIPDINKSKNYTRYLMALDLLLDYPSASELLENNIRSIITCRNCNGEWDLGPQSNDKILFPLSNNWRSKRNRVIDNSIFLLRILAKANMR